MTIDSNWIMAAGTVAGLVATIFGYLTASTKRSIGLLFAKVDDIVEDLNDYKLLAAEKYVNRETLKELLIPIERRLEAIEQDLRKRRK